MDEAEAVAALLGVLRPARRIVLFTGAGISTESGIPDFRSPGGTWSRMRPIDFGDFVNGAKLVIVNRDPTALDDEASLVINANIGTIFAAAVEILR